VALVVAVLAVAGGAAALFLGRSPAAESPLQAQVETNPGGALAMVVTVPGMPAGTMVRYAGQQQSLDAQGRARFTLDGLGNRVGAIDLPLEVVPANGEPQRRTARIVLAYRVEPDLANLAAERPSLQLVFHVVPGSQLFLNDQPVATDRTSGLGAARIDNLAPIPVDGPDALASTYNVRVVAPDGTVATGTYQLRVPRTPLLLERPARGQLLTASERVVVRGRAPGATRVTLEGAPVELRGDTFTTLVPVANVGRQSLTLVAYSRTGAPAQARIDIERVAPGDRGAVARFLDGAAAVDWSQSGPTAGQRVRLRGRVLGAPREWEGGQAFQLVVAERGCEASRCLVWVDIEPGHAPAEGASVQVVGTVVGRRQSVTASGERRSDPVVHAALVF
jgi:hypothetical protein